MLRLVDYSDLQVTLDLMQEKAESEYTPLDIYHEITPIDALDDHMEVEEENRTWDYPAHVFCLIKADPSEKELKKFGMDVNRHLLISIPTVMLENVGLVCRDIINEETGDFETAVILGSGDRFYWNGHNYEIKEVHTESFWVNTSYPLWIRVGADIRHIPISTMQPSAPEIPWEKEA